MGSATDMTVTPHLYQWRHNRVQHINLRDSNRNNSQGRVTDMVMGQVTIIHNKVHSEAHHISHRGNNSNGQDILKV
jgi:hypothetical protein